MTLNLKSSSTPTGKETISLEHCIWYLFEQDKTMFPKRLLRTAFRYRCLAQAAYCNGFQNITKSPNTIRARATHKESEAKLLLTWKKNCGRFSIFFDEWRSLRNRKYLSFG